MHTERRRRRAARHLSLGLTLVLVLTIGCSDNAVDSMLSPSDLIRSRQVASQTEGKVLKHGLKPIKRKSLFEMIKERNNQTASAYDAVPALDDFIAYLLGLEASHAGTDLAKSLKEVREKAMKAVEELSKTPPDEKDGQKKIDEAEEKLVEAMEKGKIDQVLGEELRGRLDDIVDLLLTEGGYEGCRGQRHAKFVKRSEGGRIWHCGNQIKAPKDALKQDSELSIYVLDTEDVIVDFGPDGWFDKQVEIILNVEGIDLEGIDKDKIVLAWLDEATGTWYGVETKVDRKGKKLKAKVWHFTQYTLSVE